MRAIALAAALLLAGCAGTQMTLDGSVCGQPLKVSLIDRKDRSTFDGHVVCPGGGSIDITTADSSTSQVITAMAANIDRLGAIVERLLLAAPGAALAWEPGSYGTWQPGAPTPTPAIAGMTYVEALP